MNKRNFTVVQVLLTPDQVTGLDNTNRRLLLDISDSNGLGHVVNRSALGRMLFEWYVRSAGRLRLVVGMTDKELLGEIRRAMREEVF